MRKFLNLVLSVAIIAVLTACGGSNNDNDKQLTKLVIAASNVPHAEILEKAQPLLADQGIELEIRTFQDYVVPNKVLSTKEVDANYFQHIPYLEGQIKEHGYDFEIAGHIHIEPMGIYSQKHENINDLPDGSLVIMSSSVADHGRVLSMLEREGIIKLDPAVDKVKATQDDIIENPKQLKFETNIEPAMLARTFTNNEGDIVAINSNYALDADLVPLEDAIVLEEDDSPYVNVIAVRTGDKQREEIKALVDVLMSEEIQQFILEKYGGSVVPVTN